MSPTKITVREKMTTLQTIIQKLIAVDGTRTCLETRALLITRFGVRLAGSGRWSGCPEGTTQSERVTHLTTLVLYPHHVDATLFV
jgi:hypothetical protein